jgi:hypothetical protein
VHFSNYWLISRWTEWFWCITLKSEGVRIYDHWEPRKFKWRNQVWPRSLWYLLISQFIVRVLCNVISFYGLGENKESHNFQMQWLTPEIPATLEEKIGRIKVWRQPGQKKKSIIPFQQNNLGMVALVCHPSSAGGPRQEDRCLRLGGAKNWYPTGKITNAKNGWRCGSTGRAPA